MKWLVRSIVTLAAVYATLFGAVALAMLRPPDQFGRLMTRVPEPLVWGVLPGSRMWLWARQGSLSAGDAAPDFTLSTHDRSGRVTLSSYRGQRPVVLVFGSYT